MRSAADDTGGDDVVSTPRRGTGGLFRRARGGSSQKKTQTYSGHGDSATMEPNNIHNNPRSPPQDHDIVFSFNGAPSSPLARDALSREADITVPSFPHTNRSVSATVNHSTMNANCSGHGTATTAGVTDFDFSNLTRRNRPLFSKIRATSIGNPTPSSPAMGANSNNSNHTNTSGDNSNHRDISSASEPRHANPESDAFSRGESVHLYPALDSMKSTVDLGHVFDDRKTAAKPTRGQQQQQQQYAANGSGDHASMSGGGTGTDHGGAFATAQAQLRDGSVLGKMPASRHLATSLTALEERDSSSFFQNPLPREDVSMSEPTLRAGKSLTLPIEGYTSSAPLFGRPAAKKSLTDDSLENHSHHAAPMEASKPLFGRPAAQSLHNDTAMVRQDASLSSTPVSSSGSTQDSHLVGRPVPPKKVNPMTGEISFDPESGAESPDEQQPRHQPLFGKPASKNLTSDGGPSGFENSHSSSSQQQQQQQVPAMNNHFYSRHSSVDPSTLQLQQERNQQQLLSGGRRAAARSLASADESAYSGSSSSNSGQISEQQRPLFGRPAAKGLVNENNNNGSNNSAENSQAPLFGRPPVEHRDLASSDANAPLFGRPPAQQDLTATNAANGPLFGRPPAQQDLTAATNTNAPLFGRPPAQQDLTATAKANAPLFGRPPAQQDLTATTKANVPLFGRPPAQQDLTSTNTNAPLFGRPPAQQDLTANTNKDAPLFGRPPAQQDLTATNKNTNTNGPLFGRPPAQQDLTATNTNTNAPLFGRPPAQQDLTATISNANAPLFGRPPAQQDLTATNTNTNAPLFGRPPANRARTLSDGADSSINKAQQAASLSEKQRTDDTISSKQVQPLFGRSPAQRSSLTDDLPTDANHAKLMMTATSNATPQQSLPIHSAREPTPALGSPVQIAAAPAPSNRTQVRIPARLQQMRQQRGRVQQQQNEGVAAMTNAEPRNPQENSLSSEPLPSSPTAVDKSTKRLTEEEMFLAAIAESKRQCEMAPLAAADGENVATMTAEDMELAKDNARTLRSICSAPAANVEATILQFAVDECKNDQKKIRLMIEQASEKGEAQVDIASLLDLNGIVLNAIEMAEEIAKGFKKKAPSPDNNKNGNLEIGKLVKKKDIFSLICLLRANQNDRRLDAALALMRFARAAERDGGVQSFCLRDEIRSSGGMNSLLTLFRTRNTIYELKVVAALAVAYVLPSFVVAPSCQLKPGLGLKIMECLRFLSTSRSVTPSDESISSEECFRASAMGLTTFWVNQLEPMLNAGSKHGHVKDIVTPETPLGRTLSGLKTRGRSSGGSDVFDQRQESIELQELAEMTVSLIIHVAQESDKKAHLCGGDPVLLVEQVCAVEVARPIAVREGILRVLVGWLRSKDKEKTGPAASALSHLTSIKDKYMAGWIHSQMVNEGALPGIVAMTHDFSLTHDVRLAIAQILSSLCVAPHTRAAVVEADCIHFLVDILYQHTDSSSQEEALFAGSALLQLAAGAITRASVFRGEDVEQSDFVSPDKRDTLIDDIIARGAISSFVAIATGSRGKLRAVSIEALRVLSEDTRASRKTRLQLCEDGAAKALGVTLKDDISRVQEELQTHHDISLEREEYKELHDALCALANILDPIQDSSVQQIQRVKSSKDSRELLIHGCLQIAESGGLESLLCIASLPLRLPSRMSIEPNQPRSQKMDLLDEACRSLASLSPLLLSEEAASKGYSKWADNVLRSLSHLLIQLAEVDDNDTVNDAMTDLHVNVLQGLAALAKSAPLKVRIIDKILHHIIQAKSLRDRPDLSNAATQTFQALEFGEDEVAIQVTGNNPTLLADWFCLQRSLLLQAMARAEIRQVVLDRWNQAFRDSRDTGLTNLIRAVSDVTRSEDEQGNRVDLFESFANDQDSAMQRLSILRQYQDIYGGRQYCMAPPLASLTSLSEGEAKSETEAGLLARQMYPLNDCYTETSWILDHARVLKLDENEQESPLRQLSLHVQDLLRLCFPSELLRENVVPVNILKPDASFNFRAFMMPQRRYFSFRREGQLLSRLCDSEAAALDSADAHWTLGFTNSSFAGEFAESLVQVLYLCPMIHSLSFARNSEWRVIKESDKENRGEEGGAILANLAGSLPPWISHLTFEGVLNDRDLRTLVAILETMGKLSAGQASQETMTANNNPEAGIGERQGQGRFVFLSIRNSHNVRADTWSSFFKLLGRSGGILRGPSKNPTLSSLTVLDLSGNGLGDEICAALLQLLHDKESGCRLEELDLSGNRIETASSVLAVLSNYAHYHRADQVSGVKMMGKRWKSSLNTLRLASNDLFMGRAWLEIVALLKNNVLELKVLDLASNGLSLDEDEYYGEILASSILKNTSLCHLNLSKNRFSSHSVDELLGHLEGAESDSGLGFLDLSENEPPLNNRQLASLRSFSVRSRKVQIQRFFNEIEQRKLAGTEDLENSFAVQRKSIEGESVPTIDELMGEREDVVAEFLPGDVHMRRKWFAETALHSERQPDAQSGDNMITVLFSAPLVFKDGNNTLRPFAKLDFDMERELMWQCLKEASRDIELSFDNATHDRLLATMAKRCSCLHYSGHGHQQYLPFEDGSGGPNWFQVDKIKSLIAAREGGVPFRFVFVSACHSGLAGETFASAGVPHVVCCQQEFELKDAAALAFTRQFYLALAVGHTVKESFEQGCKAVRATPNLQHAEREMEKFVLLPRDGNHDVPIFNAKPVLEWPRNMNDKFHGRSRRSSRSFRMKTGGARSSELSVRNMMQEDPSPSPPQFFMGREVEMYYVLNAILQKRLVSVVGEGGIGRSSLVCALCHYINERASTISKIERIYYVRARRHRKQNPVRALIQNLLKKLIETEKAEPSKAGADLETLFDIISKSLKYEKALIVFDRIESLEDSDEGKEFPMLLSNLFHETRNVRVLLTAKSTLGIASLGGQVEHHYVLGPLNFASTVRLFSNLCPFLHTPSDRRKLFEKLVNDGEEAELLPTDPGLRKATRKIFAVLGDGIPSRIEKAAYAIAKDDFVALNSGSIRNEN